MRSHAVLARLTSLATGAALLLLAPRADASFHVMQIEQVIAGVDGSTATQAIQLRMRTGFQNQVQNSRLVVRDAAGLNPVILATFPGPVAVSTAGSRVLIATASFSTQTNPALTPDQVMTNPIPDTYMAAGTLTFEDNFSTVYWRVSWGGAGYTGPTTGSFTNDADGDFGVLGGALPTSDGQALLFQGAANAPSTNNAADYLLTGGPAVFTRNDGTSATIVSLVSVPGGPNEGLALGHPMPNPVVGTMTYSVTLPREERVQVDLYDANGRRVAGLIDAVLPAGRNAFTWDPYQAGGARMRAGVYFLGLKAEGAKKTARIILLGPGAGLRHVSGDGD